MRGFLSLINYYQKCVQQYATIATSFTSSLTTDDFKWIGEAQEAFNKLKVIMTTLPILSFPNFEEPLIIEIDAFKIAIRVVLFQNQHPIAFSVRNLMQLCKNLLHMLGNYMWL